MRMLAYGVAANAVDDYVRIAESTSIESLKKFVQAIIDVFGNAYLRTPNSADICRLLSEGERREFLEMLGSIDCMHWKWKNCPVAWKGMYAREDHREPYLILKAVTSYDLWIWHAFFGLPGSHDDINVLDRSPIFTDLVKAAELLPPTTQSMDFIQNHLRIRDKRTHSQLQADLVEHLWHFQGRYEEACD
ncbi:putative nuclease HARBI1 [Cinnamomum micranthum f. kanehirae]|uniref:Putative nuclease HARBI1 n=1 Tax=Cinnamomum micranthum f. kanehirae TaxID=337451 RepID=A0A3S3MNS1_9MAGN|nr:putative nuclease HARBI1 [Cinnamomum micranthum f. kanehirae]